MMRMIPSLAAASTAAFLVFGGAAFAMATGGGGGHPGGAPGGGSTGGNPGGHAGAPMAVAGCDYRADQTALEGPARRTFIWRCQQGDGF